MATEREKKRKGAGFLPLVFPNKAFTPQAKGRKESQGGEGKERKQASKASNKEEKNNN
jgi:hypothetical protein